MWPNNMSGFPYITGITLYFCIQDMLQGRSFPVQPNIIGQKFDMYPYFHLNNESRVHLFHWLVLEL